MFDVIIEKLKHPGSTKASNFVDKLNFQLTTITLFCLALLSTLKSYVGDPIDCWTPEYFTSQWIQYVDNICWMKNTYYIPDDMSVGEARDDLNIDWELTYYQWAPIILGLMALSFYFPNRVWHSSVTRNVDINQIVELFRTQENEVSITRRDAEMDGVSKSLDHFFRQRLLKNDFRKRAPLRSGFFKLVEQHSISVKYMGIKVVYILVALFDLWLLTLFFGTDYYYFGVTVARLLAKNGGDSRMVTSLFPKITLCDFYVREKGYVKTYTVMCVLTINLFTEKIFLIVWTLLVLNILLTSLNLIIWLLWLSIPQQRLSYIKSMLRRASKRYPIDSDRLSQNSELIYKFVNEFLKSDGVLILRLIEINTTNTFGCDFVIWVFKKFMEEEKEAVYDSAAPVPVFGKRKPFRSMLRFSGDPPPPAFETVVSRAEHYPTLATSNLSKGTDEADGTQLSSRLSQMSQMNLQKQVALTGHRNRMQKPLPKRPTVRRPEERSKLLDNFIVNQN